MHIANPIYDVVFKYLMEDNEIAKLIIGTIIEEEIVELEFLPQETTVYLETLDRRSLTVYRLDFSAKIKLPEGGHKQILIEIQKTKISTDIMRFRQYMAEVYHFNMIKTISDRINKIDRIFSLVILLILLILSKNAFDFVSMSGHE